MKKRLMSGLVALALIGVGAAIAQVTPRFLPNYHEVLVDVDPVPEPPAPPLPEGTPLIRMVCDRETGDRYTLIAHADATKPGGLDYRGITVVPGGCRPQWPSRPRLSAEPYVRQP